MSRLSRVRPRPGQESVWDFPCPPRLESVSDTLRATFSGETLARTDDGLKVLETSHPPVYYIPPSDVRHEFLIEAAGRSFCEFKGIATYWSLHVDGCMSEQAAWSYPEPTPPFAAIRDHLAFYASRVDECWVGSERVIPQEGNFYGGWITSRIVGPFKGRVGTLGW